MDRFKNNKTQYKIFTNSLPRYGNNRKPKGITQVPSNKICYNQPSGFSNTSPNIGDPTSPYSITNPLPNPGDPPEAPSGALDCLKLTDVSTDKSTPLDEQFVYPVTSKDPTNQGNLITSYTSLQIYNSSDSAIWIKWSAAQAATSEKNGLNFNDEWTKVLTKLGIEVLLDDITAYGYFELGGKKSVLLPYFGISVRIAPALDCVKKDGGVECQISGGGTPSPQTLFEYTWNPTGSDIMDFSFVDGFSLPARLDYVTNETPATVTSVYANCSKNTCPTQYQIIKNGKYAGCASPCSYENNLPVKDDQQINEVCCAGNCGNPSTACTVGCINTANNTNTIVSPYVVNWCNLIESMILSTPTPISEKQPAYCYAYNDGEGSIGNQQKFNTRIKITFCLGDIGQ